MKVVLAPDKFKDALDARGVCQAMAAGILDAQPQSQLLACPMADGGEGTGPLLAEALHAPEHSVLVLDALARHCQARWWLTTDQTTAVIEMAEASGLWRLAPSERRALRASSYGTGQLIQAAFDAGVHKLFLCVGGSATVDGGAGCLQALGWRMLDASGRDLPVPLTGADLPRIARLEPPARRPSLDLQVLCDVDNPLLGRRGAAPVFGPQKGASPDDLQLLAAGLASWAGVLQRATGVNVTNIPRAGASGGLPAGILAAYGAKLVAGFDALAAAVNLREKLAHCDWCLTGEGRLDEQTLGGKTVAGVVRLAAQAGVATAVFVGTVDLEPGPNVDDLTRRLGATTVRIITPAGSSLQHALANTANHLRRAVADFARGHSG